ncbi:MAG: SDR family NAD(P)-dependent oxidoreductase [Sphingobacteriales bacterium]|nr:SDR family NAD(P)-dependent oxidoreductase [Sphingobacteriales bacterium]
MPLQTKIAVVAGASRGIGRAIATQLAAAGAQVILLARNQSDLNEALAEITQEGGLAAAFGLDISDEQAVKSVFQQITQQYKRIDILVNNAGIGEFYPVSETSASFWDEVMNTNVKGTFLCSKEAVIQMQRQGSGHIVSIASDVAKRTFANGALYCSSKYAQDAFSSALRKEVRKDGIKVSVVYPGLVDTYFNNSQPGNPENATNLKPEDIAASVLHILAAPKHVVIDELMIHPISQDY